MTTNHNNNQPQIILHPSIWINRDGERDGLGEKLAQHLRAVFPVSEIELISEALFIQQEKTYGIIGGIPKHVWYFNHCKGEYEQWTHQFEDNEKVILVWGSGEHHQVSSHISLRQTPYSRIVWDRHQDNGRLSRLSMEEIIARMVPAREGCFLDCEKKYKKEKLKDILFVNAYTKNLETQIREIHGEIILHGSVDLDVVRNFPARGDWQHDKDQTGPLGSIPSDQRGMFYHKLIKSVYFGLKHPKIADVRRFDIGGLHPIARGDEDRYYKGQGLGFITNPNTPKDFDFAVHCYEALIRIVYERMRETSENPERKSQH